MGEQLGDLVILSNDFNATSPFEKMGFMMCTQIFGVVPAIIKSK